MGKALGECNNCTRQHITLPCDWDGFLRVGKNQLNVFQYLAKLRADFEYEEKEVLSTCGKSVRNNKDMVSSNLHPCMYTWESRHKTSAPALDLYAKHGYRKIIVRTVYTNVVMLATTVFRYLDIKELWIPFGKGKYFRFILVHEVLVTLGPEKVESLEASSSDISCFHCVWSNTLLCWQRKVHRMECLEPI